MAGWIQAEAHRPDDPHPSESPHGGGATICLRQEAQHWAQLHSSGGHQRRGKPGQLRAGQGGRQRQQQQKQQQQQRQQFSGGGR